MQIGRAEGPLWPAISAIQPKEENIRRAFDRRGARARGLAARPPASSISFLSPKNTTIHPHDYLKPPKMISLIERLKINLTLNAADGIARALNVPFWRLIKDVENLRLENESARKRK